MALIHRYTDERYTVLKAGGIESGDYNYFWRKIVKLFNFFTIFDYKYTKSIDYKDDPKSKKVGFNG